MSPQASRTRLSRDDRRRQLLASARDLIREIGTDEFTLGRLAERAGVTKPVVYDHFGDRTGALAALYKEFEAGQRTTLRAVITDAAPNLRSVAEVIGAAYIDCSLTQGRELADVIGALASSSTLAELKREEEDTYLAMCRDFLAPHSATVDTASMRVLVGAGDSLSRAVLEGRIGVERARNLLGRVLYAATSDNP